MFGQYLAKQACWKTAGKTFREELDEFLVRLKQFKKTMLPKQNFG